MKSGIYSITNTINSKKYVGSSQNVFKRIIVHKRLLKTSKHHSKKLQNSYNKYGLCNFTFEVLEFCPKSDLLDRELFYFNKFFNVDAFIKGESNLFREKSLNIQPIPTRGNSSKTKRTTFLKSKETRGYSNILKVNYIGKVLNEYELIMDIHCTSKSDIRASIGTKTLCPRKSYGFVYKSDFNKDFKFKIHMYSYNIYQYDCYCRFVKKYRSYEKAALYTNFNKDSICTSVNRNQMLKRYYFTKKPINKDNTLLLFDDILGDNTIKVFTIYDEFIGYSTPRKVTKLIKCHLSSVYQVLNGYRKQCKLYKFSYL